MSKIEQNQCRIPTAAIKPVRSYARTRWTAVFFDSASANANTWSGSTWPRLQARSTNRTYKTQIRLAKNKQKRLRHFRRYTCSVKRLQSRIIRAIPGLERIPAYLTKIVHEWLNERTFSVEFKTQKSTTRNQENGIPQGSSLSVLLWLIFVYDIPLRFDVFTANTYVDDTIGWVIAENKHEVKHDLTYQLRRMAKWCESNKVKINQAKTHVIFNESNEEDNIVYKQYTIKTAATIKYLGAEIIANDARK